MPVPPEVQPFLPIFFDMAGQQVSYDLFDGFEVVAQRHNACRLRYIGTEPLKVSRIMSATGYDMPVLPGSHFATECWIEVPNQVPETAKDGKGKAKVWRGKVKATGEVIRGGQVVRD